jgi:hypothetical protein
MRLDDTVCPRATKAIGYSADRTWVDLDSDALFRLALTKLVEIVVEGRQAGQPGSRRRPDA